MFLNLKNWFFVSATIIGLLIGIFISTSLIASHGISYGQHIFGYKISGTKAPASDISGAIRLAMLPDIKKTITSHPFFGSGLATKVSYIDPQTKWNANGHRHLIVDCRINKNEHRLFGKVYPRKQ